MLARCRAPNITEYYASVLQPGTTQLLIVMELMAASAADLVRMPVLQTLTYCITIQQLPAVAVVLSNRHLCMCMRGLEPLHA